MASRRAATEAARSRRTAYSSGRKELIGYQKPSFDLETDTVLKNSYSKRKTKKKDNSVISRTPFRGSHDWKIR